MQTQSIGKTALRASRMAYGCWRIAGTWDPAEVTPERRAAGKIAVRAALEAGFTLFDHADIYCQGVTRDLFGEILRESCPGSGKAWSSRPSAAFGGRTIRRARLTDTISRPEYILQSCEQSLKRLAVETIDHLPVASAGLPHGPGRDRGGVRAAEACRQGARVRGQQLCARRSRRCFRSRVRCRWWRTRSRSVWRVCSRSRTAPWTSAWRRDHADGVESVGGWTVGGWAAAGSALAGRVSDRRRSTAELDAIAKARGTSRTAIALAWLMRHPSGIVPIVGPRTRPASGRRRRRTP
jgi:aryl-alcohol dehydrogenase-like predicted oxidoreductase